MADLQLLADSLIKGDRKKVATLTRQALDEGLDPKRILEETDRGMNVIGTFQLTRCTSRGAYRRSCQKAGMEILQLRFQPRKPVDRVLGISRATCTISARTLWA